MSPLGPSRHAMLGRLSVAFGAKRTLISGPPGRIYEFTPQQVSLQNFDVPQLGMDTRVKPAYERVKEASPVW